MDSLCPSDRDLMGWIYKVVLSKYHQFAINTVEVSSRPPWRGADQSRPWPLGLYKHFLPSVTMDVLITARKSNWLQASASLIPHGHQLYRPLINKTISLSFLKILSITAVLWAFSQSCCCWDCSPCSRSSWNSHRCVSFTWFKSPVILVFTLSVCE